MNKKVRVNNTLVGERLDKALSTLDNDISRTFINDLIKNDLVLVNGKKEKASYKVKENDEIEYIISSLENETINGEDIPLNIVYEDEDILVIDKEQGMVVHPAAGHFSGTLVNALIYRYKNLSSINGEARPGIVHRIDKDTSGLLVVAKNDKAHTFLADQLKDHTMHRQYYALVKGTIKENEGKIDLPIARSKINRQMMCVDKNGKEAITYFEVMERYYDYTLIKCKLLTGRTHQIRVHLSYIGYPIEGDTIYSKSKNRLYDNGQLLHAYELTLIHPKTKKEMTFSSPMPSYFKETIKNIK